MRAPGTGGTHTRHPGTSPAGRDATYTGGSSNSCRKCHSVLLVGRLLPSDRGTLHIMTHRCLLTRYHCLRSRLPTPPLKLHPKPQAQATMAAFPVGLTCPSDTLTPPVSACTNHTVRTPTRSKPDRTLQQTTQLDNTHAQGGPKREQGCAHHADASRQTASRTESPAQPSTGAVCARPSASLRHADVPNIASYVASCKSRAANKRCRPTGAQRPALRPSPHAQHFSLVTRGQPRPVRPQAQCPETRLQKNHPPLPHLSTQPIQGLCAPVLMHRTQQVHTCPHIAMSAAQTAALFQLPVSGSIICSKRCFKLNTATAGIPLYKPTPTPPRGQQNKLLLQRMETDAATKHAR